MADGKVPSSSIVAEAVNLYLAPDNAALNPFIEGEIYSFGENQSFDVPTNIEVGFRKNFGKLTLDAAWRDGNSLGGVLPARSGFNLTTEYLIFNI